MTLSPRLRRSAPRFRPALHHFFNPPDRLFFCVQATGKTVGFDARQQRCENRSGLQPKEIDQIPSGQKRRCGFAGQEFGEITPQQTFRKAGE